MMEVLLKTFALGAAALLAVAVLVACWEHWFRRIQEPSPADLEPQRAVSVDLDVDQLPATPACDQSARRATLGAAMDAMARPPGALTGPAPPPPGAVTSPAPPPGPWIETRPMVLHSAKTEDEPH